MRNATIEKRGERQPWITRKDTHLDNTVQRKGIQLRRQLAIH